MKRLINLERLKSHLSAEFAKTVKAIDRYLQKAVFNQEISQLNQRQLRQMLSNADSEIKGLLSIYGQGLKTNWRRLYSHRANTSFARRLDTPTSLLADKAMAKPLRLSTGVSLDDLLAKFSDDETARLTRAIRLAHHEGLPNSQLIQMIRGSKARRYQDGILATTTRHAKTIAHTGTAVIASEAKQQFIRDNADLIKGIKVSATLDLRTSSICRSLDGQFMPLATAVYPPYHFNCRSSFEIVYDDYIAPSQRASMGGVVENQTYYEWLKTQSKADIERVLGKQKAKLFLSDGMTADKFRQLGLDRVFMPMGLDELLKLEAPPIQALYQKMQVIEPKITSDMTAIVNQVGVSLAGLEYRLKSLESLERKVATEVLQGGQLDDVLPKMRDVIRYTAILDDVDFVTQYQGFQTILQKLGYQTIVVKNTWQDGQAYKGINTFVKKDDIVFELQFHTKDSFELKNGELHTLYESFRLDDTPHEQKQEIWLKMVNLSARIKKPKDIEKIN